MFKFTLAMVALAAAASAQDLSSLVGYINPNLNSTCLGALATASSAVQGYCGVSDAVSLIASNASGPAAILNTVYYLASNSTTLNTTCSDKCGNYLNDFAYTVLQDCGNDNLLNASAANNLTVTGSDLVNVVRYARRAVCTAGDNATYCVQEQLAAYEADFPEPSTVTYEAVIQDANITCVPCVAAELVQLKNNSALSTYWKGVADSYVNNITATINSTCPSVVSSSRKRDSRLLARSRLFKLM